MKLRYLKYLSAYLIPLFVGFSLYLGGYYTYSAIILVFIIIPFLELFTTMDRSNLNDLEEEIASQDPFYDFLLYSLVIYHFFVFLYFLTRISDTGLALYETIGMITAYGMAAGISINNAHELGHRDTATEKFMSKALLMTSLYMHFFIEHNRGHHLLVATDEDPASSRYGENIYAFFLRSITGSWFSALKLEKKRLNKVNKSAWGLENEMLIFQLIQLGLLVFIAYWFGIKVMLCFFAAAGIGVLMLELVNYIEHYGLRREKNGKRYERTMPIHSWNSSHPLGRMVLLELSRHSDHHYVANRKYQVLRHFEESPQMPTGYPGMMLLALFPPAWFNVMHKEIATFQLSYKKQTQ